MLMQDIKHRQLQNYLSMMEYVRYCRTRDHIQKEDFSRNTNTLTMNTMIVIYVLITVYSNIAQQTGTDIGNIKVGERYVKPVPI